MVNFRRGLGKFAFISLLAGGALLEGQVQTPTISSLQSSPANSQGPTNGAAITAGTPSQGLGFTLYINGSFNPEEFDESVTWTAGGVATPLNITSVSSTQLIANVPANLYATAGSAAITVTETTPQIDPTSNQAFFTINPAMAQISPLPSGVVGVAYSQAFFTGGTSPFTVLALEESSQPPPGLTSTQGSGNPLHGTPTTAGPFVVTYQVTDSWGNVIDTADSINIYNLLTITTASLPTGVISTPYTAALAGSGGASPYNWAVTGLPGGLSVNASTGVISGTPIVSGNFTANITLTDGSSQTATASLALRIASTLSVTTSSLPNGRINTAYSTTLAGTGGITPYNWAVTGLPGGLSVNASTGVISGTPIVSGNFTANVTLTDSSSQTATASLALRIVPTLSVTTTSLPNGLINTAYTTTLAGTGGITPYNWAVTGLPGGLSVNASTGVISGTPIVSGNFTANVTLTDSSSQTATASLALRIASTLSVTTSSLPNGLINTAYTTTLAGAGGVTPYNWAVTGLPGGLSVNASTGVISGTPIVSGNFTANITLTDSSSQTATASLALRIASTLSVATSSLPNGLINTAYTTTLAGAGGTTPYNWSVTGLPTGLSVNASTGVISGTPTVSGNFTANITLTDSSSQTATASLALRIVPTLSVTTSSLPNGRTNTAYTTTLAGAGGITPYNWAVTGLPGGLSVNASTGVISGTPIVSGNFTANITLTDNSSQTATASLALRIVPTLSVTTSSLPNGLINTAYTTTLAGAGGTTPYNWSATGLPTGLSVNAGTGVISGTPTVSGNFTANITLTDNSSQTATASLALRIASTLLVTTSSLPNGLINTAYTTTLAGAGGITPYNWAVTGLPTGLSVNASTGVISGTPTVSGNFTANVTLTDSSSQTATASLALRIVPTLSVTTSSLPNGRINTAYTTTLAGAGGITPYNWAVTGLPGGLSVNASTGVISGTPIVSGNFTANITLTDNSSQTATASLALRIVPTLSVTTSSLPNGKVGTAYTATVAATGGITPYSWSAAGLPTGLSINSGTGVISGTPTIGGNFIANITLTDTSSQTATASLPLYIVPTLVIATSSLSGGVANSPYSAVLLGAGGTPPYSWSVTGLPSGLGFNASSGIITGTPAQPGSYPLAVTLTDSGSQTARGSFILTIAPAPIPSLQVTGSAPGGTVSVPYSALLSATGGNGGPYTFSASGAVPPGLKVTTVGLIQGTPTTPGTYSFTVNAADTDGNNGSAAFSVTIVAGPLTITTGPLGSIQVGSSVAVTFAASGGVPPLTFSLTGSAPAGTSFAPNGTLSGTATTVGSYSFTVTVTDSMKTTGSKGFTLIVTPGPLTIAAPTLPSGQAGVAYSGQFTATGGTPPYTWSGSAGGGLSISATGTLSGTPTTAGSYPVSVTVTDSTGGTATGSYSVTVTPPGLRITTTTLPNGALTSAYSTALSATGGTPPYSWSVTGLPGGITASADGTLSGTPTSPGPFTVTATVKDSTGASATASLSLTILPAPVKITTTGISPPTLGTSFSVAFGATGGTPPYTWTATGLPAGVTLSSTGTLSGTPTVIGTTPITVTVTDSSGLKATEMLNLTTNLPAAPGLTFSGLPATANPAAQSTTTATFSATYPVDVTVNLTLTFTPLSGADDPNIQFSTGGRTAALTIKAGTTVSTGNIGVQTGTVAGTITITVQLLASGQDITPVPAPTKTIVIGPAAPTITSVTAATNSTGFTVTIDGFDPTRAETQVVFTFSAAAGSTLQTSTFTIPATALFSSWYQSSASAAFGSQFSFTIPFTVTGNLTSVTSVTVTVVNPTGTSAAMSATI